MAITTVLSKRAFRVLAFFCFTGVSTIGFQNCGPSGFSSKENPEIVTVTLEDENGDTHRSQAGVVDPETGDIVVGGDMIIGNVDDLDVNGEIPIFERNSEVETALAQQGNLWGSEVIYRFTDGFPSEQRSQVIAAIDLFNRNMARWRINLIFIPWERASATKRAKPYVRFQRLSTNSCYVIRPGFSASRRITAIYLGPTYFRKRTIIHEMMHVLGFIHEQQRSDRDHWVVVHSENIIQRQKHSFIKLNGTARSAYDVNSIMHYSGMASSKNGKPTMTDKRTGRVIVRKNHLSVRDLYGLRAAYGMKP